MRHLSLECRFEAWFVDFRMQMQRQNVKAKVNASEIGFYALNAAFICWMPLWSISRFQKASARQMERQRQRHRKIFLCTKCGIYLFNTALKRDFSISECKYKGTCKGKCKCKCKGKCIGKWFLCPKCEIYLLNAALKRNLSISEGKYKGKC